MKHLEDFATAIGISILFLVIATVCNHEFQDFLLKLKDSGGAP